MTYLGVRIHPTAGVLEQAEIGAGTLIWHQAQVREGVRIGRDCILAKGVYVDAGVTLDDNGKVQNYVSIYHGVTIEDGVFSVPTPVSPTTSGPAPSMPTGRSKRPTTGS